MRLVRRSIDALNAYGNKKLVNLIPFIEDGRTKGNVAYLHGLSRSGVDVANERRGIDTARAYEESAHHHEYRITETHLAGDDYARSTKRELDWFQDSIDWQRFVNPDALFGLIDLLLGAFYFFLEVERQTYGEHFIKKGRKYLELFDSDLCEKLFKIRKFRVIFLVETPARAQTVLEDFAENGLASTIFWITSVPEMKADIASPIFRTPADYLKRRHSFNDIFSRKPL